MNSQLRRTVLLAAICLCLGCGQSEESPDPSQTGDFAAYWSEQAVLESDEVYGLELDYSDDSIEHVESILAQLEQELDDPANPPPGFQGTVLMFGLYVGECARRNHGGGEWSRDHELTGEYSFPLELDGHTIFPVGWCIERVQNGEEDNVAFKYHALVVNNFAARTDENELPEDAIEATPEEGDTSESVD
jgi:hypothetical protein